jgi:hypothetical protein
MSGEATRDVTVRVSVVGGKIDKFPEFEKMTTAAEGFLQTVESGLKILKSDSETAMAATSKLTDQLRQAASMDFGDLGLGEARAAVEEMADAQQVATEAAVEGAQKQVEAVNSVEAAVENLAQAELDAKNKVEEATKSVETATKSLETATTKEGQSAAESAFKKIALSERLAAHNRAAAKEAEKLGQTQQKEMFAATGAIAGALAAGTSFVSTIKLIAGESSEIEELAKQFAQVQGVIAGIAAGTQAFNGLNQGLTNLQSAAAAATAQLAATGGTATVTQTALIRLAPAAATAQAALGPIGLAIAGISLAVAAVKAASDYFSEELPDDSERNARAFEKVNNELAQMKRQIDSNARSMEAQNNMLRTELDLRKQLAGKTTDKDIQEGLDIGVKSATDSANAAVQSEQQAAEQRRAALQAERKKLLAESESLVQQDQAEASWWGGTGQDPKREERKREISQQLEQITSQTLSDGAAAEGPGVALSASTMAEYAAAVENLPQEQQAAYEEVLDKFQQDLSAAIQTANQDLEASLRENQQSLDDNSQKVDDARKAYEEEQNIALRLQSSPNERKALEQSVNTATATGNLNAGIDAISGVVSTEREQELRNQLAQGNLTREKLLAEIADAAEFETEKAELEKQVAALNEQAAALQATREEMTKAQQRVKEEMRLLHEEIRQTQQAQQAR